VEIATQTKNQPNPKQTSSAPSFQDGIESINPKETFTMPNNAQLAQPEKMDEIIPKHAPTAHSRTNEKLVAQTTHNIGKNWAQK
jgi:hypothetical protein